MSCVTDLTVVIGMKMIPLTAVVILAMVIDQLAVPITKGKLLEIAELMGNEDVQSVTDQLLMRVILIR